MAADKVVVGKRGKTLKTWCRHSVSLDPKARGCGKRAVTTRLCVKDGSVIITGETIGGRWPSRCSLRLSRDATLAMMHCLQATLNDEVLLKHALDKKVKT